MYVIKKSLSSVVVLTTFLLTTSAFAMIDGNPDDVKKRARYKFESHITLGNIADENKGEIFIYAAGHTHPGEFRLVCQDWRDIIDEGTIQDNNGNYITPGPVWNALNVIYDSQFFNLELLYTESDNVVTKTIKFSDLTTCNFSHKYASITISKENFFNDDLETNYICDKIVYNKGKVLALICKTKDLIELLETSKKPLEMPISNIDGTRTALLFRDAGMDHDEYDYFIINPLDGQTNLGFYWDKAEHTGEAWCRLRMDAIGTAYGYDSGKVKEFYNRFSFVKKKDY